MYFRMWNASQKWNPKKTSPAESASSTMNGHIHLKISFNSPPGYENLLPRTRRRTRRPPILHTKTSTSKFRNWMQMLKLPMIAQKDQLNNTNSAVKRHILTHWSRSKNDPDNLRLLEAFYTWKCKPELNYGDECAQLKNPYFSYFDVLTVLMNFFSNLLLPHTYYWIPTFL